MRRFFLFLVTFVFCYFTAFSQTILNEGFEGVTFPPEDWSIVNNGGSNTWMASTDYYHSGTKSAYIAYSADPTNNDYLMTPALLPQMGDSIIFWAENTNSSYSEIIDIKISTTGINVSDFTITLASSVEPPTSWQRYAYDLSAYVGQIIYIAICDNTYDGGWVVLDDFSGVHLNVSICPSPTSLISSNITTNSADISWTPRGTESSWEIEYKTASNNVWTSTGNIGTNPYTLSGLMAGTLYDVKVKAICSANDESSWSTTASFRTVCDNVSMLPYTENFDNYGTTIGIFPDCWFRPVTYNPWGTIYPSLYAYTFHSSPASLMFETSTSTPTYSLTPAFNISIDLLQVSFWLKAEDYTYSGAIQVGVMANDTDINTFDTIATIIASTNNWAYYEIALNRSQYVGTGYHIAFKHANPSDDYYNYYLDDVTVDYIPTCIRPDSVNAFNITNNSADISWRERGIAISWNIEYGLAGFTPGTGTIEYGVTTPHILHGLLASTAYDVYIQSDCGGSDQSLWSIKYSFRTACDDITVLPYTENFDNYGTDSDIFPDCWFRPVICYLWGTAYPSLNDYASHSSPASLIFESGTSTPTYSLTPAFNISIESLQVSFWLKAENIISSGSFQIGVMADNNDINTFDPITTIVPSTDAWTYYEIALNTSQYVGTGYHIAFKHANSTRYYNYYLDDVTVDYIPTCIRPDNIVFSDANTTTVNVSWRERGTATSWNVEYGPTGFTLGTGVRIDAVTNPYIIQNLTSSTVYDFYVQSNCGSETSDWTDVNTFVTTQVPINIPFTVDFEDTVENANWALVNGSATNKWYIDTAVNNTVIGNRALYISNNGGVSNTYSTSDNSIVWAYRDIMFTPTTGDYQLSFDWRAFGDGSVEYPYDYIRLFIGDPDMVTASTDQYSIATPNNSIVLRNLLFISSSWSSDTITLSRNYEGRIKRLYFAWKNDDGSGSNPPGAIDNVSIVATSCAEITNLTINNITDFSAEINWTPGNAETSWDIVYDTVGFSLSTGNIISVTDTTYIISGLTPNTNYDVYVRANCGSETGNWVQVNFSTQCLTITTLPFVETFELASPTINCWRVINNNHDDDYWHIHSGYSPHSGIYSAGIFTDYNNGNNDDYLISPSITLTGNQFLSFYQKALSSYEPNDYEVLLSTTGIELSDFTTVLFSDTVSLESYLEVVLDLSAYSGNVHIAFYIPQRGLDGNYLLIDDVTIDTWPSCPVPDNLTITNITDNSATVSWISGGSETQWELDYKVSTDTTWNSVWVNTTPTYNLTGLTDATAYDVKVRAICNVGDSSLYTNVIAFSTTCFPINIFPYLQNFENGGNIPLCWRQYIVTGSTNWTFQTGGYAENPAPSAAHGGIYNACLSSNVYMQTTQLVTPVFDLSQTTDPYMTFWHAQVNWNGDQDSLFVYYKNSSSGNWILLRSYTNNIDSWTKDSISLPNSTSTYSIAFEGHSEFGYGVVIDDVTITDTIVSEDPCNIPTNLAVSNITDVTASVFWTPGGNETNWILEYKKISDVNYTPVNCSSNSYILTALSANTTYNVRVKAICGTGNESDYISSSFTTDTTIIDTYTIIATAGDDGTITPSGTVIVPQGGSQIFTIMPNNGYNVNSVLVDNVSQGNITSYTFSNVQENHTISVSFVAGIEDYAIKNSVRVFPNPTSDNIEIVIDNSDITLKNILLYDIYGKLIREIPVEDTHITVDLKELSNGLYFLRMTSKEGMQGSFKVVKE
jgi:large repetitive protein